MAVNDTQKILKSIEKLEKRMEKSFSDIRGEMNGGLSEVRKEMKGGLADVRKEMQGGFAEVREEMQGGFALTHQRVAQSEDSIKNVLESVIELHDSIDERVTKLEKEVVSSRPH